MALRRPCGSGSVVITIQRIRVRWSAADRGAPQANSRRGLCRPATLEALPSGTSDVVVHEVLADEAAGYARQHQVITGGVERARDLDLWLSTEASTLTVDRATRPGRLSPPERTRPPVHASARADRPLPGELPVHRHHLCLQPELVLRGLADPHRQRRTIKRRIHRPHARPRRRPPRPPLRRTEAATPAVTHNQHDRQLRIIGGRSVHQSEPAV